MLDRNADMIQEIQTESEKTAVSQLANQSKEQSLDAKCDRPVLSLDAVYRETVSMVRHYSNASLAVRMVTIAQGIVILAAWSLAYAKGDFLICMLLGSLGLVFNLLLFRFHKAYYDAINEYGIVADQIETFTEPEARPISHFRVFRKKYKKSFLLRMTSINSAFTFTALAFVLALSITLVKPPKSQSSSDTIVPVLEANAKSK